MTYYANSLFFNSSSATLDNFFKFNSGFANAISNIKWMMHPTIENYTCYNNLQ